jgi:hypothetical protein
MSFSPSWYTQHPDEEKTSVTLDGVTLDQFDTIVSKATLSNQERQADAIRRADSFAFQVANPWLKLTKTNTKLIDNWLEQKGTTWPTFPDFASATEALCEAGLLDVDEASYAQHLDGNGPKTFKGPLTGRTFDSIDTMIAQERQAAIEQQASVQQTDLERAFDKLPIEEQKQMLRTALSDHQTKADAKISEQNADSWITLHPEFRDDQYNGRLLLSQLKANGVTGVVTIEDYEIAERQLAASGLLRQNPAALRKQEAAEVVARAQRAVNEPGSIFDKTTEEEMYNLPLDEIRRRANGNYSGR